MPQNKIVVHYEDGRILKGFTSDFLPTKDQFHLTTIDAAPGSKPVDVGIHDLKAIFFVKDFVGSPSHPDLNQFDPSKPVIGRKIRVLFKDGETLIGTTQGYQKDRPGFFVVPADPRSNNERCFVITAATAEVSFI
jgi:hypothetical protein